MTTDQNTRPTPSSDVDFEQRCREILEWHRTGILADGALRALADDLRSKNPHLPEHEALRHAEHVTATDAIRRCLSASPAQAEVTDERPWVARIHEALDEGDGFWRSCSGCHELNEGHPTGDYSAAFRTHVGCGCSECGGLGVVWDDTDYGDMGDYLAALTATDAKPVAHEHIEVTDAGLQGFAEWFRKNYPGPDTLIHKPDWHSPKIYRAALHHARSADAKPVVPAEPVAGWQPIETAPKDGRDILVYYDHEADPYQNPTDPNKLTDYAAWAESGDFMDGIGYCIAAWKTSFWESTDEYGSGYWLPAYWFARQNDDYETAVNPTHWMPLPSPPLASGGKTDA